MAPSTGYARNGEVHIAYLVVGDGPVDVVAVPAWLQHSEHLLTHPRIGRFYGGLSHYARLVLFDRRGTGGSDPITAPVPLEEQMDDIVAVMDATGCDQAALVAQLEGATMAMLFAATHPERVRSLVLYGPHARFAPAPGYEWPPTLEEREAAIPLTMARWGTGASIDALVRDAGREEREWFATLERLAVSPGTIPFIQRAMGETDVREVLSLIRAPTLVLHRTEDFAVDVRHSRYVAQHIPGAKLVELPGTDTLLTGVGWEDILGEVEEFLTGQRAAPPTDRVLATVLFTDLVGSTQRAAELGDRGWRELLARHDAVVRAEVARHRGRPVKSLGDGWLATFDGPARAVRCALGLVPPLAALGLEVRAGVHTGEVEVLDDDVGGLAVHLAARVMAEGGPGEVIASQTVKDLVVGSGLTFADLGVHDLRGVPGEWRLFRAGEGG